MPKVNIQLTEKSKKLIRKLDRLGKINLTPVLKTMGDSYRKEVSAIFDRIEPRDASLRWAPLSAKYAAWKEKNYPGKGLLVLTGALRDSMTKLGAIGNINVVKRTSAEFGTEIAYGKYHDDGTKRLPKRNFSEPSERRLNILKKQISDGIAKQFELNGIEVEEGILL